MQRKSQKPATTPTPNVVIDGDAKPNEKSKIKNSSESSSTSSWSSVVRVVALLLLGAAMGYFVKSMDASNVKSSSVVKKSNVRVVSISEVEEAHKMNGEYAKESPYGCFSFLF